MTAYLSGVGNRDVEAAARHQPRLGMLAQPGNKLHATAGAYSRWGIDNGAFGVAYAASKGERAPWGNEDTERYLAYLERVTREVDCSRALFATAPDVLTFVGKWPVGDAAATWERSRLIFPRIRALGLPAALVAQDGMTETHPKWSDWDEFDVLFLGGSDRFKLGWEGRTATLMAKRRGKLVHMGRVNSETRFRYAQEIGCDTADGTYIRFCPRKNLPDVLGWLDATATLTAQPATVGVA